MILPIYGPEMYLEFARAFATAKIGIEKPTPDLQGPNDLPKITQLNLQFLMSSAVVIYSVSFVEANVNRWLKELLGDKLVFNERNLPYAKERCKLQEGIIWLQRKYATGEEQEKLFRREPLTNKIKLVYKTLGVSPPFERDEKELRRLWQELIDLQDLRNDLIHLKPESLESERFKKFLFMDRVGRMKLVNVAVMIVYLMGERLPVVEINLSENALISEAFLLYADNPFLETLMLGANLTEEERGELLRRQPHKGKL